MDIVTRIIPPCVHSIKQNSAAESAFYCPLGKIYPTTGFLDGEPLSVKSRSAVLGCDTASKK